MPGALAVGVKAISRGTGKLASALRVVWYNATRFAYHRPLPFSTTVYGRILTLEAPTRLRMGPSGRIGDGVYFATGLRSEIVIGKEVFINLGCVIVASERVEIGDRSSVAEYVSIRDQEHVVSPGKGTRDQGFKIAPVQIGKNVWIGRGSYIGPGTTIGDGSVVAANSVVRGQFPADVLIAGAPAEVKRKLT